jgi:uncharacterized protein YggE
MTCKFYEKIKSVNGGTWLMVLGMLLIAGIVTISILRERIVDHNQYQVSVTGRGKIAYQPDIANVALGVQVDKAAKADIALNLLNTKMLAVIAAIKSVGIAAEDIQTQNYSLSPQYDYRNNISVLSGYSANQQLTVKVKDIINHPDAVSQVLAAAAKAGINQVSGITFDVSNLEALKQQARLKALDDAKAKAGVLADAAGVKLAEPIGWWENVIQTPASSGGPYDGKGGSADLTAGNPVVPNGNQEIIIEMNLNYRLK